MPFKSVMAVVTDPARAAAVLAAVQPLALGQDAHLDLLALGLDRTQVGYANTMAGIALLQASQAEAAREAEAIAAALRGAAGAAPATLRWSVETAAIQSALLTAHVGDRARYADLVVAERPYAAGQSPEAPAIVEAALFDGRAPVLVLPQGRAAPAQVARVVVAFNESPESLVAARRALPFLRGAAAVTVLVVDPPAMGPAAEDPGGPLCRWLVRHGVAAEVMVSARTRPRVSEVIADRLRDLGADLLVMGAYGHSRLREAILGGATRNLLETADLPVFLAH